MRHSFSIVVAIIIALVSSVQGKTESVLPANVVVPGVLAGIVTEVYLHSDTFRAQCDRIAQASHLHVSLKFDVYIPHACRAFTTITRKEGTLCAEVHLPPSTQFAELIAHEFEHILEQVENLNLRVLARVRGSGVREVQFDLFETDRAQRTGKIVAMEVLRP